MAEGTWLVTFKPDFLTSLLTLPNKEVAQIHKKVALLSEDPTPDAKTKKKLKYLGAKLHRIRSGDYRIFYTFEEPYVSVLALRKRDDKTYDEDFDEESLGGMIAHDHALVRAKQPEWEQIFAKTESEVTPLPEPITLELLEKLRIPEEYFVRLVSVKSQEELLSVPGVPDGYLLKIDAYMFELPLAEVTQQPDLVASEVDDLLRFKEGELLNFLLRLDAEQEKYVTRGLKGSGPTLLKGTAGSGKSTVALYRVRELLKHEPNQRILFTTYTNALVNSSREQLEQLLGEDCEKVNVLTADKIALQLARQPSNNFAVLTSAQLESAFANALRDVEFNGNALVVQTKSKAIARLGKAYLQEEILSIIIGRGITDLDDYLIAKRRGRKVPLNKTQREAVWDVKQAFLQETEHLKRLTFEQIRALAATVSENLDEIEKYDAVLIDEAQDLDPVAVRMLVNFCRHPEKLFITADANQSIYGSGFNWNDVHESLLLKGRTGVLRTNHRSTREIGQAALSYLKTGALESIDEELKYLHSFCIPAVRAVETKQAEELLLSRYLPGAVRECRLGLGAAAVLVPTRQAGGRIATALNERGVNAEFMDGQNLDLKKKVVKVLTWKSAKGLEFPVVALAGFVDRKIPNLVGLGSAEAKEEYLLQERRSLYVAMTRAMRTLLVIIGGSDSYGLLSGFNEEYWNVG